MQRSMVEELQLLLFVMVRNKKFKRQRGKENQQIKKK